MAHVVLFHSALGLRPAVHETAEVLRGHGHRVDTPDYYEGQVFDTEADGVAHRDEVGEQVLMARARAALKGVPDDAVLAGFSLGAFFAQVFAAKRPAARAAVLWHAVAAPRDWNGVPVQVHRYAEDPWIDAPDGDAAAYAASLERMAEFIARGR